MTDLGYRVIEADSGASALSRFDDMRPIDLLFTDVVMPGGLSGLALAQRLRDRQPSLQVIFTTGYSDDIVAQAGELGADAIVLRKPYSRQTLAGALAEIMG